MPPIYLGKNRSSGNDDKASAGCFFVLMVMVIIVIAGWKWYVVSRQTEIYHRQGIQISQWDVFIGVKPNEAVIQVRE